MWMLSLIACSAINAPVVIEVHASVEVDAPVVVLGQVADVVADPQTRQMVCALDIGEFEESNALQISSKLIGLRLSLAGLGRSVRVGGAPVCAVRRVEPRPFTERVVSALEERYVKAFDAAPGDIRVKLNNVVKPPRNDAMSRFSIQLQSAEPRVGTQRCMLAATNRYGQTSSQPVMHTIERKRKSPILDRDIARGDIITEADFHWEESFSSNPGAALRKEDVIGKTVGLDTPGGRELTRHMLVHPLKVKLISANQSVTCIAEIGDLQVHLHEAVALTAGARGEAIRLKNPKSGKIFTAVVINASEARVQFP